jgi:CDGSH-type Zn-finger protein
LGFQFLEELNIGLEKNKKQHRTLFSKSLAKIQNESKYQNLIVMEKGELAGKAPQMEQLEEGKKYAWCACGKSENKLWCNGAHKGSEFIPNIFQVEESKTAAICMCKQTENPPYCDGSHNNL